MTIQLDTQRLNLRPFQDGDAESFAAYRSDPAVAKYQDWDAPYPLEKAAQFVEHMKAAQPGKAGEWYQVALELKESGQMIGDCAIHTLEDPRQAEIGFTLATPYHGKGYATEAVTALLDYLFGDMQIHRVSAICDVENLASAKLLERIGMRREAHLVENIYFKGQWGSEYIYAILHHEWTAAASSLS